MIQLTILVTALIGLFLLLGAGVSSIRIVARRGRKSNALALLSNQPRVRLISIVLLTAVAFSALAAILSMFEVMS